MAFELAQVIAQLVQAIAPLREAEGSQDGLMDLLGRPASDLRAAVQEDFHQPDDARLVDLDAGITHRADGNRQGNALQQRKVPVNVEPLGLVRGEAAGNGLELLPDRIEILQALLETEVPEVVGAELIAQERCELLVLLQERVLEVGAIDMVAVLDLLDDGGELAGDLAMQALPEDLGDLVGCQPPQPQLTASLEQLVDGKVLLEDEVTAVFDLRDRIEAREIDLLALLGRELRPQDQGPIVKPLADDRGAQFVGGPLQGANIINGEERVVVLTKGDLLAIELLLDEVVAVEVIRRLEGKERRHTHDHGTEHFIADVEIVVGEPALLAGQDAVVGIRSRELRLCDTIARPLLHALEDEVDAVSVPSHHLA